MNHNQPFVSIIVNCYNSDEYLSESLDSVFAQSFSNWEIVFWDNNSTDKSAEIAKSYGGGGHFDAAGLTLNNSVTQLI